MIPVILTHIGQQSYVRTAILQAQMRNEQVILLGGPDSLWLGVEYERSKDYWDGAAEFAQVYKHMSHNPYKQELYCFQIYFLLRDFCRKNHIERFFTMDSDVMLYCDVTKYERGLGDYDLAINWCERQEPYRWSACLHNSFWKLTTLEAMCSFIMDSYVYGPMTDMMAEKWRWHLEKQTPGGVCDMTLLHLFRQHWRAVNLSSVRNGSAWDDNINISENYWEHEYEMDTVGKKILLWRDGIPCGYNLKLDQVVRFNALHFQGQAKKWMETYKG